jgi:hypothetical protein
MTDRERFRTLMAGGTPDRVPFLAFSELVPEAIWEEQLRGLGMGLIVHASSVVTAADGFEIRHSHDGALHTAEMRTPRGTLTARYRTDQPRISGSGEIQTEWYVKVPEDYEPMIWSLEHTDFTLDSRSYHAVRERLGEHGVTHTWCDEPPYMGLQYLLGWENWVLHQVDHPVLFRELLEVYGRMQDRRMRAQLAAPERDLINIGNLSGNYSPRAYAEYTKPYFDRYAKPLRELGCSVTIHADALNLKQHVGLLPGPYVNVVEAFTPPPVGNLSIAEARAAWGPGVTLHVNVPETVFHSGYEATFRWTRDLLASDPCPNKFLSFTEVGLLGVEGALREVFLTGIRAVMDALHRHTYADPGPRAAGGARTSRGGDPG